jgi:Ca-activated chloride channel homolog
MTPAANRVALHHAIDRLRADGNTNLQAGLLAGYQVARAGFRPTATNRVIVASDGLANTGSTSSARIAAQFSAEAGKQITLLGVGVGRDYGDKLMEALVDHADGFVVYVSDPAQARQVFVSRLPGTVPLRALDAKAQVTFEPSTVAGYRLIGYDDRALPDPAFTNDHVDGGEVAAGYTVTALYAVRLLPGATGRVAEARVRWLDPVTRLPAEAADSIDASDLATPLAQASPRLQTCYAAAFFAEVLRGSPYGRQIRLGDLAVIAANAAIASEDPAVSDLSATIRRAAALGGQG